MSLIEQLPPELGGGSKATTIPGQIPQDSRRVVFHDGNYDPPKDSNYNPSVVTWHWDNIQIFGTVVG